MKNNLTVKNLLVESTVDSKFHKCYDEFKNIAEHLKNVSKDRKQLKSLLENWTDVDTSNLDKALDTATEKFLQTKKLLKMANRHPNPKYKHQYLSVIMKNLNVLRGKLRQILRQMSSTADTALGENVKPLTENRRSINTAIEKHGSRKTGQMIINYYLKNLTGGFTINDLPDTPIRTLDEIEKLLNNSNYDQAMEVAKETAREIAREIGVPALYSPDYNF